MRILFVCALSVGALSITGCVNTENLSDPITDKLAQTPLMYKPDIQQGNVISQEQINRLEPGMSKNQVRYLMGTPMLVDTFHQDRWDYVFTMKKGGGDVKRERVALFFKDDQLVKIEGNFRPQPNAELPEKDIVITVPDHEERKIGIMDRTLKAVGLVKESPTEQMKERVDELKEADKDAKEDIERVDPTKLPEAETEAEQADPTALPKPEKAADQTIETVKEKVKRATE